MNAENLTVTSDELLARLRAYYGEQHASWLSEELIPSLNKWLARGDGVAVYENHDLGHPDAGELRLASYGSCSALLEGDVPPARLPDIGSAIGWRFTLVAMYRSSLLPAS